MIDTTFIDTYKKDILDLMDEEQEQIIAILTEIEIVFNAIKNYDVISIIMIDYDANIYSDMSGSFDCEVKFNGVLELNDIELIERELEQIERENSLDSISIEEHDGNSILLRIYL